MTTTGWIISLITLVAGLVVGYFAGFLAAKGAREASSGVDKDALAYQVSKELAPLNEALHALDSRVGRMDTAQKHHLDWVISELGMSQQTGREVLAATQKLDTALRGAPTRGSWGELSLRRVLEMSGLAKHIDFDEQVRLGGARPDVVVNLPGDGALVIDSKVPLDAYMRSFDDEELRAENLKAHSRAVRSHVNQLANRKYADIVPGSLDVVVLYMPSEALIGASLEADPQLFDDAIDKGIVIAGPSALHTLLRVVGYAWSKDSLEQDAREILQLGRTLAERINLLSTHLAKLGDSLRQTVVNYNSAVGSFEKRLAVTARNISSIERSINSPIEPIDHAVRQVPELGKD
ncbi:MAG: DNA recombination protein RmuC [Actinomycetaceae bacterium]|nr:DNA recombination protein RmuC [Actinomycetaceae bacterium]